MNIERLHELFDSLPDNKDHISFKGFCCDCGISAEVIVAPYEDGFHISGGAVYILSSGQEKIKCEDCYNKNPAYTKDTEVYTRCVGYFRPIDNMSKSKQAEVGNRKMFNLEDITDYEF